jgi:hypothetical protein
MVNHKIILRAYNKEGASTTGELRILQTTKAEFVPALLVDLATKAAFQNFQSPSAKNGFLHLLQPVHRTFNVIVAEAVCDAPGYPRLDPRKIESAGLVVRQVGALDGDEVALGDRPSIWSYDETGPLGWQPTAYPEMEPDPARRRPLLTANSSINSRLSTFLKLNAPDAERTTPMFVAPREICDAIGRTLLFGVVPVTSSEEAATVQAPPFSDDDLVSAMPAFLAGLGPGRSADLSGIGNPISRDDINQSALDGSGNPLNALVQDLRLIYFGWSIFDPGGEALVNLLKDDAVKVTFADGSDKDLSQFLQEFCSFAFGDTSNGTFELPTEWPLPGASLALTIRNAVRTRLQTRLGETIRPGKRFDDDNAVYIARAFVRARCREDCPPQLQWAEQPTAQFTIAPWWENGGPVQTISLPDLDALKKPKPNIAFALPPSLANLLNGINPKDFLAGKKPATSSLC